MRLLERAFKDREEWALAQLTYFPDDHPMQIISQHNATGLGEKLGWFTSAEIARIIERNRASARATDKNGESP